MIENCSDSVKLTDTGRQTDREKDISTDNWKTRSCVVRSVAVWLPGELCHLAKVDNSNVKTHDISSAVYKHKRRDHYNSSMALTVHDDHHTGFLQIPSNTSFLYPQFH